MAIHHIEPTPRMSQAVVHGNTVYLAGQVGTPGDSVADQMRYVLKRIEQLLGEAGSDKTKILSATIWLADIADYAEMNSVWDEWVREQNPPVRATGEVRLAAPGYKVEVIIVAAR